MQHVQAGQKFRVSYKTQEEYNAIPVKSPVTVYFIDEGAIYVGDRLMTGQRTYANVASFPAVGIDGMIYIARDTNRSYYWNVDMLTYTRIGFDKEDIKTIDANF